MQRLVLVLFAVLCLLTPLAAHADPLVLPEEVQAALNAALADPPIDTHFVCEVAMHPQMIELSARSPIYIALDDESIRFGVTKDYLLTVVVTTQYGETAISLNTQEFECDSEPSQLDALLGSSAVCDAAHVLFQATPRSKFWAALTKALQSWPAEQTTSG